MCIHIVKFHIKFPSENVLQNFENSHTLTHEIAFVLKVYNALQLLCDCHGYIFSLEKENNSYYC